MFRKTVQKSEELRLFNVSGVDTFALETEPPLFGFSCDENDGPPIVTFGLGMEHVAIHLEALRRLLDDAEADLLRQRREWQAAFTDDDPSR